MTMIYDGFCFFNEFDVLEMRLNILNDVVDRFILVESSVTHTGVPKPYYFEENKERYSKFLDKIIHIKVSDTPNDFINLPPINGVDETDNNYVSEIYKFIETQTQRFNRRSDIHYGRDFFQKESVRRGFRNCNDDDIIMFSDCDEIPNPHQVIKLQEYLKNSDALTFLQSTYYYHLNVLKELNWKGTKAAKFSKLKNYSLNELRADSLPPITNGGWHFSYMGGVENVKNKIKCFSAQEMNNQHVINSVEENIKNDIDPFFRSQLTKVEIDSTYPKYLLNNVEKYKHMVK